jgi:hypothetical protein
MITPLAVLVTVDYVNTLRLFAISNEQSELICSI